MAGDYITFGGTHCTVLNVADRTWKMWSQRPSYMAEAHEYQMLTPTDQLKALLRKSLQTDNTTCVSKAEVITLQFHI